MTCSLWSSLPFLPTHQAPRYRCTCKARYRARGSRLPGGDSHSLDSAALPCQAATSEQCDGPPRSASGCNQGTDSPYLGASGHVPKRPKASLFYDPHQWFCPRGRRCVLKCWSCRKVGGRSRYRGPRHFPALIETTFRRILFRCHLFVGHPSVGHPFARRERRRLQGLRIYMYHHLVSLSARAAGQVVIQGALRQQHHGIGLLLTVAHLFNAGRVPVILGLIIEAIPLFQCIRRCLQGFDQ